MLNFSDQTKHVAFKQINDQTLAGVLGSPYKTLYEKKNIIKFLLMRKIENHYFEKCEKWKVAQLIKILQKKNKLIKKIKKDCPPLY